MYATDYIGTLLRGGACLSVCAILCAPGLAQTLPPEAAVPAEMTVIRASSHAVTDRLDNIIELHRGWRDPDGPLDEPDLGAPGGGGNPGGGNGGSGSTVDPVLQKTYPSLSLVPAQSFSGIAWNGGTPPDPNLAVGLTQVVEIVNTAFAVYDKSGNTLLGPTKIHTLFTGSGGACEYDKGGDPIVLFDQTAQRWVMTRNERPTEGLITSYHVCIAVSQTADALGAYHLYDYDFGPADHPDYPKLGVWPDAYYFSANIFQNGSFIGARACALDRAAMIGGAAAPAMICFQSSSFHSLLPSSLDGSLPPASGTPNYFLQSNCCTSLALYKFHVDFGAPASSTFTGPVSIPVAKYATSGGGNTVPQWGTTEKLEDFGGGRLMYRLSYRNFGAYESLLVSHTVRLDSNAPSGSQSGIRWYEIRNPGAVPKGNKGGPLVYQQSTFSPDTTTWRWMGSIGQDKMGNMLLGYSASSPDIVPTIKYTARLANDPLNQMQMEGVIFVGFGSQLVNPNGTSTRNRWGDYTSVAVDPVDDCTLWYINEYLTSTGWHVWQTRLASFKFPACN